MIIIIIIRYKVVQEDTTKPFKAMCCGENPLPVNERPPTAVSEVCNVAPPRHLYRHNPRPLPVWGRSATNDALIHVQLFHSRTTTESLCGVEVVLGASTVFRDWVIFWSNVATYK